MKFAKRVQRAGWGVLVAGLLAFTGSAAAQEPYPQFPRNVDDVGQRVVEPLQTSLHIDSTKADQFKVPRFQVEFHNAGENDLVLSLGTMSPEGRQYPTSISLILHNAQGESQRLELKSSVEEGTAGNKTLLLPLPAGASFSLPIDLENYWAAASKQSVYDLKPGAYSLEAEFVGLVETSDLAQLIRPGLRQVTFDRVIGMDPLTHISNKVQFEVAKPPLTKQD